MKRYVKSSSIDTDALDNLFEELVPSSGKADTVAGEIVRAAERIGFRWFNDGDQVGVGYGKETCNPAARYLVAKCDNSVSDVVVKMKGETYLPTDEEIYDSLVRLLARRVVKYIEDHPELREEKNTEDYIDYRDRNEDVDDTGWDEDEDYY